MFGAYSQTGILGRREPAAAPLRSSDSPSFTNSLFTPTLENSQQNGRLKHELRLKRKRQLGPCRSPCSLPHSLETPFLQVVAIPPNPKAYLYSSLGPIGSTTSTTQRSLALTQLYPSERCRSPRLSSSRRPRLTCCGQSTHTTSSSTRCRTRPGRGARTRRSEGTSTA